MCQQKTNMVRQLNASQLRNKFRCDEGKNKSSSSTISGYVNKVNYKKTKRLESFS